ncbi:helix-turn-helix domain-containing protein [Eubacterium aggregans]|uniref:helix-turn-helix domain-containing protein n=1 Tax=Eubacterium aggregans TaxID=81409 RepID=UPI003F3D29E3
MEKLDLINVNEASQMLHVCTDLVYRLCREDSSFPAGRIGARWFISANRLQGYIDKQLEDRIKSF